MEETQIKAAFFLGLPLLCALYSMHNKMLGAQDSTVYWPEYPSSYMYSDTLLCVVF